MLDSKHLKTRIFFLTALVILAAVVIIGCGHKVTIQADPNYFPSVNGYRWVYEEKLFLGTVESWHMEQTAYISGTSQLPTGLVVINMVMTDEVSSPTTYYYSVNATGVYNYGNSNHSTTEADRILAFPLVAGQTWTRSMSPALSSVALGFENVTVPAGTFRAMKVMTNNGDFYEWYSDGVGLVKTLMNVIVTTFEAGTGRVVATEGTYARELKSKNF